MKFESALAVAASGLVALNSNWSREKKDRAAEAKESERLEAWELDRRRAVADHGTGVWRKPTGGMLEVRAHLREGLVDLEAATSALPSDSETRQRVAHCLNEWHEDMDESLREKHRIQPDVPDELWWKGNAMEHREQSDCSLLSPIHI